MRSRSPKRIREELLNSGSATINDTILLEKVMRKYKIYYVTDEAQSLMFSQREQPSIEEIQVYIDAIETVRSWDESGYHNVNGWNYENIRNENYDWNTDDNNYIRLSHRGDKISCSTSETGELFVNSSLLRGSRLTQKVKLSAATILHSISPDMFDYLYDKYRSMYNNLVDIRGIGDTVATQLLSEKECSTAFWETECLRD